MSSSLTGPSKKNDLPCVGLFLWGKIPSHYQEVEQLTEQVLQNARVFITPGFIFGKNGERYIRISLCCPPNQLSEALQRIKNTMNKKNI